MAQRSIALYRSILRESKGIADYNFRSYGEPPPPPHDEKPRQNLVRSGAWPLRRNPRKGRAGPAGGGFLQPARRSRKRGLRAVREEERFVELPDRVVEANGDRMSTRAEAGDGTEVVMCGGVGDSAPFSTRLAVPSGHGRTLTEQRQYHLDAGRNYPGRAHHTPRRRWMNVEPPPLRTHQSHCHL